MPLDKLQDELLKSSDVVKFGNTITSLCSISSEARIHTVMLSCNKESTCNECKVVELCMKKGEIPSTSTLYGAHMELHGCIGPFKCDTISA